MTDEKRDHDELDEQELEGVSGGGAVGFNLDLQRLAPAKTINRDGLVVIAATKK